MAMLKGSDIAGGFYQFLIFLPAVARKDPDVNVYISWEGWKDTKQN